MSDDREAIRRVLEGDLASFRVLIERYQGRLFGLLRGLLPEADCEDVAQEVFLAAYQHLPSYRPHAAQFSTWLFTIARNKCLNLLEKRRPVALAELPEPIDERTPEAVLSEQEFFRQMDAALAALPFEQRTAFVLAEFQELPYEEIARIEGVSLGTVKSRIARARAKLRGQFQPEAEQA
jgi:RNA polymerase sigma factor (sigma-70 family)